MSNSTIDDMGGGGPGAARNYCCTLRYTEERKFTFPVFMLPCEGTNNTGKIMLTQARLKELMTYDAETGLFTRIKSVNAAGRRISNKPNMDGYLCFCIDYKMYLQHRAAWLYAYGEFPKGHLDHINRLKNDNRLCNLRVVTDFENSQNRLPAKNNLYPHVYWIVNRSRFRVRIKSAGKSYVRLFKSFEDAKKCSDEMRKQYKPLFTAEK
jgi:hypothetical protein